MKLLLIVGLKGGVGKTTTAVGTALALSRAGLRVGLLDLDYRTPNVLEALGDRAELTHSFDGDVLIPPVVKGIKVFSMSFIWPPGKSVQIIDSDAMDDVLHLLSPETIQWGDLDYLVCDTPPTSVGVVQVALETPNVAGSLIVTHASTFARADTLRTIDLFREKQVPILGMVCNQVGLHDLEESDLRKVAEDNHLPYFITIPHTKNSEVLRGYFDQVARAVLTVDPLVLKVGEVDDTAWRKLLLLTRSLNGN